MSTHLQQHRAAMQQLAYPAVAQFIANHAEYKISPDQSGSLSNTNYVIFGERRGEPVIFKYFCEDERKAREVYALRHLAATGLVPRLLAESGPRLIVQSRIPGGWLPRPGDDGYANLDVAQAGFTLGQAVAKMVHVPLSAHAARHFERNFYDGLPLERYWRDILDAARHIVQNVSAYQEPIFTASLDHIDAHLPNLLAQPRLLYHQDALNLHFVGSDFAGFFDLEMCRVGTAAMQIGALWYIFAEWQNWPAFAQGYGAGTGRALTHADFHQAKAFADFLVWRYATRSGRWRGDPDDAQSLAAGIADATGYAASLAHNNRVHFGA